MTINDWLTGWLTAPWPELDTTGFGQFRKEFTRPEVTALREQFAGPAGPPVEANVFLKNVGPHKIKVIVYLRSVTGRGLADLKELVETPDSLLFEQIMYCDAKEHKEKLEELGAIIELQETGWMNV